MKHTVIALKKHRGTVTVDGVRIDIKLPPGCTGILFCFESKKAAREYWGNDVPLVRIEIEKA